MNVETCLPDHYPAGTKYVVEANGPLVNRYIEFPDGRRLKLSPRKALTCRCLAERTVAATATPPKSAVA